MNTSEVSKRHLTIVFILICTSTLGDAYAGQMFTAVEEFIEEIRRFAKKQKLNISIDTLINADRVYWQKDKAIPLDEYEWRNPNTGGNFNSSKVFLALKCRLYKYVHDDYVPILYLFSGKLHPKLDCNEYQDLIKYPIYKQAVRNSVSLKEITEFLKEFATSPENIFSELTPECLKIGLRLKQNQFDREIDKSSDGIIKNTYVQENELPFINSEMLYDDLKSKYDELLKKYQNSNSELQKARNDHQTTISENAKLSTDLQTIKSERDNLSTELQNIRKNSKQQYLELYQKYLSLVKLSSDVKTITSERDKLSTELQTIKSEKAQLSTELQTIKSEKAQLSTELQTIKNTNVKLCTDVQTITSEKSKLSTELQTTKGEKSKLSAELHTIKISSKLQCDKLQNELDTAHSERDKAIAEVNALACKNQLYHNKYKVAVIASGVLLLSCILLLIPRTPQPEQVEVTEHKAESSDNSSSITKTQEMISEASVNLRNDAPSILPSDTPNSVSTRNCTYNRTEIDMSLSVAHEVIYDLIRSSNPQITGNLTGKLKIDANSVSWVTTQNTLKPRVSPVWLSKTIENNYKYPSNCTGSPVEVTWTFKYLGHL
ncbi:MAG: hypothetical protein IJ165_03425 [Proteobacteria bacterium]|nr:hypothetical protein [Pseudomonadota bacterium]